jgi:hypothetical protein
MKIHLANGEPLNVRFWDGLVAIAYFGLIILACYVALTS